MASCTYGQRVTREIKRTRTEEVKGRIRRIKALAQNKDKGGRAPRLRRANNADSLCTE